MVCRYRVCHRIFRANLSTGAMPSTPKFEPLTPPLTSKRPGVCKLRTRVNALIKRDKWRQVLLFARPEWVPLVKRQGLTPVAECDCVRAGSQKALGHTAPIDAMKSWYAERPHLFHRKPRNRPGPDKQAPRFCSVRQSCRGLLPLQVLFR